MTNKDFIEKLSRKTGLEKDEVKDLSASLIQVLLDEIADGNSVTIHGLGVFEPREKRVARCSILLQKHILLYLLRQRSVIR